ncbi:hypothetical protein BOX15_Mlig000994g55 [Macrostomum lignano]|uniref:Leucine-rich repeat flightless-interacting protein 2 n=1 Tax=Macrostomum lignano TaxID=282301 RepID=A0A267G9K3_9PLAT|nr:hypothetical protein BOX15_Mlig000994g55 [Macrostomum lignano]
MSIKMDNNGVLDDDLATKRDRQSSERRQLTATAREVKRREDENRIKRQEERAADGGSYTSSSKRGGGGAGRRASDFSVDSCSLGSDQQPGNAADRLNALTELREQLAAMEAQYERALCGNAELASEKQVLSYEAALLADKLEDAEEANRELQRAFADKRKESAYLKNQVSELTHQCEYVRRQLEQRDQLIAQSDCVLLGEFDSIAPNVESKSSVHHGNGDAGAGLLLPRQLAERVQALPGSSLEGKLRGALDELAAVQAKKELLEKEVQQLQDDLERANRGRVDTDQLEKQREAARQLSDHKYKLATAQQQITALQADVIRLEGQVKRLTKKAEEADEECGQAKAEARNQKRLARELASEVEDLKSQNNSLRRNLERLRAPGGGKSSGGGDAS